MINQIGRVERLFNIRLINKYVSYTSATCMLIVSPIKIEYSVLNYNQLSLEG